MKSKSNKSVNWFSSVLLTAKKYSSSRIQGLQVLLKYVLAIILVSELVNAGISS